jgi:hypothetical protein
MTALNRRVHVTALAALLAARCSATDDAGEGVVVRDTVLVRAASVDTVQIVENPAAPAMLAEWSVSAQPEIDLGGPDAPEDEALFRVVSAYRLSDGRIIVADGGSTSLKVFGPAGDLMGAIGRPGEGPGEFRGLNHVALLPGDSIAVWDFSQARLTVFDAAGVVGREVRIGATPASPRSNVIGVFADASLLAQDFIRLVDGVPQGLVRHSVGAFHLSPAGLLVDSLDAITTGESWFVERNGGFSVFTPPFARATSILAAGEHLITGDTERPEIRVFSADGTPHRLVRWVPQPRLISAADIDNARSHAIGDNPTDDHRTNIDRMFAEMRMPTAMPAFGLLRVDVDGNLWAMDYRTEWDEADIAWTVFAVDGRMIARLSMPGRFRPTHIGRDFVLGITQDEFDVEHVQLFSLARD